MLLSGSLTQSPPPGHPLIIFYFGEPRKGRFKLHAIVADYGHKDKFKMPCGSLRPRIEPRSGANRLYGQALVALDVAVGICFLLTLTGKTSIYDNLGKLLS